MTQTVTSSGWQYPGSTGWQYPRHAGEYVFNLPVNRRYNLKSESAGESTVTIMAEKKQPGSFAMWYPSVTSDPRTMAHGDRPSLKSRAE